MYIIIESKITGQQLFIMIKTAASSLARQLTLTSYRSNQLMRLMSSADSTVIQPTHSTTTTNDNPGTTTTSSQRPDAAKIHEPPYLEGLKPKVGYYELLNLQLKGYDFVVLEKYQSYLHKTMKKMEFNVVKTWSVPHQELEIENLVHRTSAIENSYRIKIYERNLQMKDALVTKLPILIDIINMTTPPGISFNINRHSSADEDRIYFRDSVLEKLQEELQELKDTPLIGVSV